MFKKTITSKSESPGTIYPLDSITLCFKNGLLKLFDHGFVGGFAKIGFLLW